MQPSTRAFASADLASVGEAPAVAPGRTTLGSIVGHPAGAIGATILISAIAAALLAPVLATSDPFALTGRPLSPPSRMHLMGTDALGRDLFSGVMHGAGTSLLVAACVGALALLCGVAIGLIAGYRGGIVDDVLMRFTELFQVLPRFFLVALTVALFGPGVDRFVLALGLTSWPVLARVVRSEVVAMRHLDFVLASEALGASRSHVFLRVLLPHVWPNVLVLLGLLLGQVLLMEASLGFLGFGDPSVMTWGMLAGQAQSFLRVAWWLSVFPGLAIMLTVMGFNLFADATSAAGQRR